MHDPFALTGVQRLENCENKIDLQDCRLQKIERTVAMLELRITTYVSVAVIVIEVLAKVLFK